MLMQPHIETKPCDGEYPWCDNKGYHVNFGAQMSKSAHLSMRIDK